MKAYLYHLQINVSDSSRSFSFYKDLLDYLGFKKKYEEGKVVAFSDGKMNIWLEETDEKFRKNNFHRKNTGLNHLAFRVETKEQVDRFHHEFLQPRKIATLYSSPKLFLEYSPTYYAVFFEDPDRIKLEVVSL